MSAPLFRTAIPLASRTAAQAVKRQQPFSIMSKLRHFGRAIEPHPFERLPVTQRAQAADWSKDVRQLGGQALVYFPALGLLLGWPFLAKSAIDGHV